MPEFLILLTHTLSLLPWNQSKVSLAKSPSLPSYPRNGVVAPYLQTYSCALASQLVFMFTTTLFITPSLLLCSYTVCQDFIHPTVSLKSTKLSSKTFVWALTGWTLSDPLSNGVCCKTLPPAYCSHLSMDGLRIVRVCFGFSLSISALSLVF